MKLTVVIDCNDPMQIATTLHQFAQMITDQTDERPLGNEGAGSHGYVGSPVEWSWKVEP